MTSDLPTTLFQSAQSSLVISPLNFFATSPTKRVTQAVTVKAEVPPNSTSGILVDYNGADMQSCMYDMVCILSTNSCLSFSFEETEEGFHFRHPSRRIDIEQFVETFKMASPEISRYQFLVQDMSSQAVLF